MHRKRIAGRAQSLAEYIIAVALVGIALFLAIKTFGWRVEDRYSRSEIEVRFLDENPRADAPETNP